MRVLLRLMQRKFLVSTRQYPRFHWSRMSFPLFWKVLTSSQTNVVTKYFTKYRKILWTSFMNSWLRIFIKNYWKLAGWWMFVYKNATPWWWWSMHTPYAGFHHHNFAHIDFTSKKAFCPLKHQTYCSLISSGSSWGLPLRPYSDSLASSVSKAFVKEKKVKIKQWP